MYTVLRNLPRLVFSQLHLVRWTSARSARSYLAAVYRKAYSSGDDKT